MGIMPIDLCFNMTIEDAALCLDRLPQSMPIYLDFLAHHMYSELRHNAAAQQY